MVDLISADNQLKDLDLDARLQIDPKDLIKLLNENEKMLIGLKSLFSGWDEMINALEERINSKPKIPDLVTRLMADVQVIKKLRYYELKYNIKLDTYLG